MRRMFTEKQVEDIAKGVAPSESDIQEAVANADEGTIAESLGLDSEGKLVKGVAGKKLYMHLIKLNLPISIQGSIVIYSTNSTPFDFNSLKEFLINHGLNEDVSAIPFHMFQAYGTPSSPATNVVVNVGIFAQGSSLKYIQRRIESGTATDGVVNFTMQSHDGTLYGYAFISDTVNEI